MVDSLDVPSDGVSESLSGDQRRSTRANEVEAL